MRGGFQIRKVGEKLGLANSIREHLEEVGDADAHAAGAKPSVAPFRVDVDARGEPGWKLAVGWVSRSFPPPRGGGSQSHINPGGCG